MYNDRSNPNYKQTKRNNPRNEAGGKEALPRNKQTITKTIDFQASAGYSRFSVFFLIDRRPGRPFRKKIERKNERYINEWLFCTSEMIFNSLNLDANKNLFSKKQKEAFSMAAALNLVSLGSKLRDVALDRIAKATVKTQDLKREAQNSF